MSVEPVRAPASRSEPPRALPWWRSPGSNRGHADFQSAALPAELPRRRARSMAQPDSIVTRLRSGASQATTYSSRAPRRADKISRQRTSLISISASPD